MLTVAVAAAVLAGCAFRPQAAPYAMEYRQALQAFAGTPQDAQTVARRFVSAYADLDAVDLAERIEALYAERIYFNDTLVTIRDRSKLLDYLHRTAGKVQVMEVEILGAIADGNDVYLRWFMHLEFKAGWRDAASDTVGMTHLRLDESGRIVLHQDFWDNAEGIFRQVPVVDRIVAAESY